MQTWRMRGRPHGRLVVAGLFSDNRGVAQAAKLSFRALGDAGLDPVAHDITSLLHGTPPPPPPGRGGVLLMHVNPPEIYPLFAHWPVTTWADRYRVSYWNWELDTPPPSWGPAAAWFDEVWAPSAFTALAFRKLMTPGKVRVMPLPVPVPASNNVDGASMRARLGIPDTTTLVLAGFDFRSSRQRKNPEGTLVAFEQAVPAPEPGVALVLKVSGHDANLAHFQWLQGRVAARRDIHLLTEQLDADAMQSLIMACDVLISLHRSEGFGLWLAEAMRAQKAVIATGWSGNLEFMDDDSAALAPFSLTHVVDPGGPYDGIDAQWAEPDTAVAARLLRELIDNPARRQALGARAALRAAALDRAYDVSRFTPAFLRALTARA